MDKMKAKILKKLALDMVTAIAVILLMGWFIIL